MKYLLPVCALLLTLVASAGIFFNLSVAATNTSNIFISEINHLGSSMDNNCKVVESKNRCGYDKWLEITNASSVEADLSQYTLRFRSSLAPQDNLSLTGLSITPQSSILIAYDEVNYNGVLAHSDTYVAMSSAKLLRMSNKDSATIGIDLINPEGGIADSVNLSGSNFFNQQGKSLELIDGQWIFSTNPFFSNHFASPGFLTSPLPVSVVEESPPVASNQLELSNLDTSSAAVLSQASSQNEVNVELATVSSDILIEEVVKSSVEVGVMADIEQAVTSIVVQNTEKVAETIEAQKTAVEPIKTPELVLSVDSVEPGKVDAIQEDNVVTKIESGKSELKDKLLVVQAVPAVILSGAQEVSNEQIVLSEIQNQQVSSQVNIPEPPVIEKIVVSSIIEESDSHSVATEISSVDKKTNVVSNSLSESLSLYSGSASQASEDLAEHNTLNNNSKLSVVRKSPAAIVELPTISFNYGSISEKNLYNSYISSSLALSDSIMKVSYADSLSQSLYKIIFSNFLLMLSLLIERIRRCSRIENRYYV